jgi:uncharacterized membrane protein YfcA
LSIFFGLVLLGAGIRMIVSSDPLPTSTGLDDLALIAIAFSIGLVSGFFAGVAGIGGGVVIVPATVMLLGFSQHQAQGTSLLAIILTSIAATIINRKNRRVSLMDAVTVGAGGVAGSLLASRVALGIDGRILSVAFGILAVVVALRTLYREIMRTPEPAQPAESA